MTVQPQIDFSKVDVLGNRLIEQLNALREVAPIFWNEAEQSWVISGHAEVMACFRGEVPVSAERFKLLAFLLPDPEDRQQLIGNMLRYFSPMLINIDPPAHARLRRLMAPAFGRRLVEEYRPAARAVIHQVLDGIAGKTEVEFVDEVARQITGLNILRMMGFQHEAAFMPRLARWAFFAVAGGSGVPTREILKQTDDISREMAEAFLPIIQARRDNPTDDFVSLLVHAGSDGDRMSDDEIVGNLILIMLAGHDTTLNTMALSVDALSRHPEAVNLMRGDAEVTSNAVMELSRYVAMSTQQGRVVAEDFEWQGHQFKAGQIVNIMTAAANRDPRAFAEPERLDVTRDQSANVTFGPGIHHCIGHLFAKMQLEEFFTEFLNRYSGFEVLEDMNFAPGLSFRGPVALKVRLTPR